MSDDTRPRYSPPYSPVDHRRYEASSPVRLGVQPPEPDLGQGNWNELPSFSSLAHPQRSDHVHHIASSSPNNDRYGGGFDDGEDFFLLAAFYDSALEPEQVPGPESEPEADSPNLEADLLQFLDNEQDNHHSEQSSGPNTNRHSRAFPNLTPNQEHNPSLQAPSRQPPGTSGLIRNDTPSPLPNPSRRTTRESTVVDLTSSPIESMPPRKRKAATPSAERASKVARVSSGSSASGIKPEHDVVDLVDVEDDTQYKEFQAKQQAELAKQQLQEEATRPVKLSEFQCIICMDFPTDLTVTHCGHLFCSECLHQALHAGNGKKQCPVCRSGIVVTAPGKRASKNGAFHLEMKLMTANKKGKRPVK